MSQYHAPAPPIGSPRPVGRPSKGHVKLHLSLHPDVKDAIEAEAKSMKLGVSEYVALTHRAWKGEETAALGL